MDIRSLSPELRCRALVGGFMQNWALLEFDLHKAIAKVMGLTIQQALIVGVNMDFAKKIYVCRTAINISSIGAEQIRRFDSVLNQIANYSQHRNYIAHNPFSPMENGDGVCFYVFKAKGKFKTPDMNWSVEDFEAADKEIDRFRGELNELENKLNASALVQALMKSPTARPTGLGGLFGWSGAPLPTLGDILAEEPERRSD